MKYSWAAYSGGGAVLLALVLGLVSTALFGLAIRLKTPLLGPRASGGTVALLVVVWLLAILTFLVDIVVYAIQSHEVGTSLPSPPNPVTPVTLVSAALTFVIVAAVTPRRLRTRLANGLLCACAGPMVFELPFDLIVMARTTAIPPTPALYILLFFLPLFAIEVLTLTLAVARPDFRVTRWTLAWLAAMLAVFAAWALIGFHYPAGPVPITMNIVAKVLAFATMLSAFVRREWLHNR